MAKLQGDEAAEQAIGKAIEDVNNKIVQEIKEGEDDEDEKKEVDVSVEEQQGDEDKEKVDEEKEIDEEQSAQKEEEEEQGAWTGLAKETIDDDDADAGDAAGGADTD